MKRLLILIGLLSLTSCYTNPETPAGFEGYVYEKPIVWGKGGFHTTQTGPTSFGFSIWNNKVLNLDMRTSTYDEGFEILCQDKVNMKISAQALLSLTKGSSKDIVNTFGGEQWYKRKVKKVFRSIVRKAVQKHKSGAVKENRNVIQNDIREELGKFLKDTPINLEKLVIGNIDFPAKIVNEIENRVAMEEKEKAMGIKMKIAKQNAELRQEEAKGIAKAQAIIDKSLTNNYLQYEAIKAQAKMADSPNHTTIYIPVGNNGIPLMRNSAGGK